MTMKCRAYHFDYHSDAILRVLEERENNPQPIVRIRPLTKQTPNADQQQEQAAMVATTSDAPNQDYGQAADTREDTHAKAFDKKEHISSAGVTRSVEPPMVSVQ